MRATSVVMVLCVVTLIGCATIITPPKYLAVVPTDCPGCASPQVRATQEATDYCAKTGKSMAPYTNAQINTDFGPDKYTLMYTCVSQQ